MRFTPTSVRGRLLRSDCGSRVAAPVMGQIVIGVVVPIVLMATYLRVLRLTFIASAFPETGWCSHHGLGRTVPGLPNLDP